MKITTGSEQARKITNQLKFQKQKLLVEDLNTKFKGKQVAKHKNGVFVKLSSPNVEKQASTLCLFRFKSLATTTSSVLTTALLDNFQSSEALPAIIEKQAVDTD